MNPTKTPGRPAHIFGMAPNAFAAWKLGRQWGQPLEALLDEGGALGVNWSAPEYLVELTSATLAFGRLFWLRITTTAGRVFTPPMPVHRDDIPTMLAHWGLYKGREVNEMSWSDSARMKQDFFKGVVPRSFVLQPGPYWYLTQDHQDESKLRFFFDKLAPSQRAPSLAFIIGPEVQYCGEVPASKLPTLGDTLQLAPEMTKHVAEMMLGSSRFFQRRYVRENSPSLQEILA